MHILLTNDDGPPSTESSPYILSFVRTLQAAGHTVSVCLPHTQKSWIGKAHIVNRAVKPSYYRPPPSQADSPYDLCDQGETSSKPLAADDDREEWVLVDSTPASCVQIGLYHYFKERGPIDLVVSGPNYGRNTTVLFALSSGTIGGAMEAAVCGVKSIALSFAFFDRKHDSETIAATSRTAVRIIDGLYKGWHERVMLYTVNLPLEKNVETAKVFMCRMLQNKWSSEGCFTEVTAPDEADWNPEDQEEQLASTESTGDADKAAKEGASKEAKDIDVKHLRYKHKHFKWTPDFAVVKESVEKGGPGTDGWALNGGSISITPLRANFMHVDGLEGEVEL